MKVGDIIKNKVYELGGDGLVNTECSCGCGDKHNWFPCDCPNTEECKPAKWTICIGCEHNGQCEYQEVNGFDIGKYEGCYLALQKEEK